MIVFCTSTRYGPVLLPESLCADSMAFVVDKAKKSIQKQISDAGRVSATSVSEVDSNSDDLPLSLSSYRLDTNSVPPQYVLDVERVKFLNNLDDVLEMFHGADISVADFMPSVEYVPNRVEDENDVARGHSVIGDSVLDWEAKLIFNDRTNYRSGVSITPMLSKSIYSRLNKETNPTRICWFRRKYYSSQQQSPPKLSYHQQKHQYLNPNLTNVKEENNVGVEEARDRAALKTLIYDKNNQDPKIIAKLKQLKVYLETKRDTQRQKQQHQQEDDRNDFSFDNQKELVKDIDCHRIKICNFIVSPHKYLKKGQSYLVYLKSFKCEAHRILQESLKDAIMKKAKWKTYSSMISRSGDSYEHTHFLSHRLSVAIRDILRHCHRAQEYCRGSTKTSIAHISSVAYSELVDHIVELLLAPRELGELYSAWIALQA